MGTASGFSRTAGHRHLPLLFALSQEPCDTFVVSCLPKPPYRPTEVQLVNLQVKEEIGGAMMDPVPEIAKKIWNEVKKGTKSLNSEIMLKNLFLRQRQRMEVMTELEDKMNVRFPVGYKRVSTLRAIATEVRTLEVGQPWMRGKCGNMPSVQQLEDDPEELPPMAKELLQFDEVDRSILCEVVVRTIDLARGIIDGRFEAVRLEADAGPERGAAEAAIRPPLAKEMLEFDEVYRSILREVTARTIELAREKAKATDESAIQPPPSEDS
jgi:hypothetical protein